MIACPTCPRTFRTHRSLAAHFQGATCNAPSLSVRFWVKVEKGDGCWLYTARLDKRGYGRFGTKGKYTYAHRVAWMFTNGEIPEDMEVCHTCDVRRCCNPAHLFLGTHHENMLDCKAKNRQVKGEGNKHAKITEQDAIEILKQKPAKRRTRGVAGPIAAKYGISTGTVGSIWAGRTWKHLSHSGDLRE